MKKYKVLQVLYSGEMAGAETNARILIDNFPKDKYEFHVCFFNSGGKIADQISKSGVQSTILNIKNGFDLLGALRFVRYILRHKFDIIHFNMPNLLTIMLSLCVCRRVIYHIHDSGLMSGFRQKIFYYVFRNINTFIAISNNTKNNFISCFNVAHEKISVIYNPIDVSKFRMSVDKSYVKKQNNICANKLIIGFVGRLIDIKGCDLLLRALSKLKKSFDQFHLLVLGDGILRNELEKLSDNLGLKNNVSFLGVKENIEEYFNIFDIFVLPSKREGFGRVIVEAMACACPVAAFAVGGIPEAFSDAKDGFLVKPLDIDDLSEKILILLRDDGLRVKFGESALNHALDFDIPRHIEKIEKVYNRVLSEFRG